MSSFNDSMYEDGFDDPSDYLDYLCGQADLEEEINQMAFEDSDSHKAGVKCPICKNVLRYYRRESEFENIDIIYGKCAGYPVCFFTFNFEVFAASKNSEKMLIEKIYTTTYKKKNMQRYGKCKICNNDLEEIRYKNVIYSRCCGYPSCYHYEIRGYIKKENLLWK